MDSTVATVGGGAIVDVSVIIPTKDRAAVLRGTLDTLLDQTVVPAEIVIVDQTGGSETAEFVRGLVVSEGHGDLLPNGSRLVYRHDPEVSGAGAARNVGIDLSTCPILVFLDDDVLLETKFLEELLIVYDRRPGVGGVSGIIANYTNPSLREKWFERVVCRGPFRDERMPLYWNADRLMNAEPIPIRKVSGGVMSVTRSALGEHRFNPEYQGRGEDVEFSWRVSDSVEMVLTPRARLVHLCAGSGRVREHWITSVVTSQYYLYDRLWRGNTANRLYFGWFNLGVTTVALGSSIRRLSWEPLKALLDGIRRARRLRAQSPPLQAG